MQVTSEIKPAPTVLSQDLAGGCHDSICDEQAGIGSLLV